MDATGCADEPEPYAIEQRQVDHACLHTEAGPFAFVETDLDRPPELRHTHTAYTLRLVATAGGYSGAVRVKPRESSVFAFYSQPEAEMTMDQVTGPTICPAAQGSVSGCARLAAVRAFSLEGGREYVLRLGPVSVSTILVIMEAETAGTTVDAAEP